MLRRLCCQAVFLMLAMLPAGWSEYAVAEEMKPVLAVSVGGYDAIWQTVDSVADRMGYKQAVVGFRSVLADVQGLDKTKPGGIVVLMNDKEVFPFGFLPVKSLDELQFVGIDDIKDCIKQKDGVKTYVSGKIVVELLEKDGRLYIFEKGKSAMLPGGDPVRFIDGLNERYPLAFKIWPDRISPDLLDNIFSVLRQQLAGIAELNTQLSSQVTMYRKVLEALIDSASSSECGLRSEKDGSLVLDSRMFVKPGSKQAGLWKQGFTSRWNSYYRPENAVFACRACSFQTPEIQGYQKDNLKNAFYNTLNQLETTLDEDTASAVKDAIHPFYEMLAATSAQVKLDTAATITDDGRIMLGSTIAQGEKLVECLERLNKLCQKSTDAFSKKCIKINSDKANGYTLSSVVFSFEELAKAMPNVEIPPFAAKRELALWLAVKEDAVIMLFALDAKAAAKQFKELIAAPNKQEPSVPGQSTLSWNKVGKLMKTLKLDEIPEQAALVKVIDRFLKADPKAAIDAETKVKDSVVSESFVIKGASFAMLGDIIRELTATPKKEKKKSEDGDSLFD